MAEEEIVEAHAAADYEQCFGGCTSLEIFAAGWKAARPLILEGLEPIAERLIDQQDEPWPDGTESDRLHYWRDKAIEAAQAIRGMVDGR